MRPFAPAIITVTVLLAAVLLLVGLPAGRPAQPGPGASLELLEMDDVASGAAFTVRGQVHNPAGAPERDGLSALVTLFDNHGVSIGSGESEVATHLAPGQTATFVVTLDATTPAAHYRVSFRQGRAVIPHVDRRSVAPDGATSRLRTGGAGRAGAAGRSGGALA